MQVDSNSVVTIILAVIAAVGATTVNGLFSRPKMSADAKAASAEGDVSISGDAREWARFMADRAERAETKASAAETRMDDLEDKVRGVVEYVGTLQREVIRLGGTVPPPPESLIPPLSHPPSTPPGPRL